VPDALEGATCRSRSSPGVELVPPQSADPADSGNRSGRVPDRAEGRETGV
jgi:hypothetical protein